MKVGKRSGTIFVRRSPKGGRGRSWDLGPTLPAPYSISTWNSIRANWNNFLTYWR